MTAGHYYANWIKAGLIYPYVQNVAVYKCPADLSKCPFGASSSFAVASERTYSVNCYVGGMQWWNRNYQLYRKLSDMNRPGPAHTWVFIEENSTSIDDCYFALDPAQPTMWYNSPAVLHGNASVLTYADGHSEVHRWTDGNMINDKNPQVQPGCNVPADPKIRRFGVVAFHNHSSQLDDECKNGLPKRFHVNRACGGSCHSRPARGHAAAGPRPDPAEFPGH